MTIQPGQVFWGEFDASGLRPAIVISREPLNRGDTVIVVPCTSKNIAVRRRLLNCVFFAAGEFGLPKDTIAQTELTTAIPLANLRLESGPLGELDDIAFRNLIRAVGYAIGSECEPA